MIPIKFNDMNLGENNMNEKNMKMELSIEGSDLDYTIKNIGYGDEKVQCEFNLYFESNPKDLIQFLKLLENLNNIKEETYAKLEEGSEESVFLTDTWKIDLKFLGFIEDD